MSKVERKAKIRNRCNQVPYLTQNTIRESDKNTRKYNIQESQEVSPFTAGDHKAARNSKDKHETKITKRIHKKEHHLGTVSKKISGGLKHVYQYQPLVLMCVKTHMVIKKDITKFAIC